MRAYNDNVDIILRESEKEENRAMQRTTTDLIVVAIN